MSVNRRVVAASGVIVAAVLLASCSGGGVGVDIPLGADELAPCPATDIVVDDLGSGPAPDCDLAGSSIVFPGVASFGISDVGAVNRYEGYDVAKGVSFHIVNWGVPGVGVSTSKDNKVVDIWGSTPDAVELQREQLLISDVDLSG